MESCGKVVVAGATGLIGSPLCAALAAEGYEVIRLVRHEAQPSPYRDVLWEGKGTGPWAAEFDGAEAAINLSGRSVACRWTRENRREILESRIESTQAFAQAIDRAPKPPNVWINSSAVGYYGDRGDEELDEKSGAGQGFLTDVCVAWEGELFRPKLSPRTRRVAVRTGVVLAREGGTFPILLKLAKGFLGGKIGSGRQWESPIHMDDLVRLYVFAVQSEIAGPVNGVMPKAERNVEFMMVLRHLAGRDFGIPAPEFAVRLVGSMIGPDAELSLTSARVLPKAALEAGFAFRYVDLDAALQALLR